MNNQHNIGKRISNFELYDKIGPITGVSLLLDDVAEPINVGDDSGYVMEISCPYGDEAVAKNLLAAMKGNYYQGFRAENAVLSPAAELGDNITVKGIQSMLAHRVVHFGPGHMSEIAAPGENTLEHEYQWKSPEKKEFNRKIEACRSEITKNSKEIALRITKGEAETLISATLSGISMSVKAPNGTVTSFSLSSGGTIDLSGLVTFSSLGKDGTTEIDGSRITTGTIDAKRIKLYGPLNVYKKKSSNSIGGYLGYCEGWNPYTKEEEDDGEVNPNIGIGVMNTDETGQCICTEGFARLSYGNYSAVLVEESYLQLNGYGAIYFGLPSGGRLTPSGQPLEFDDYAVLDEDAFYCNEDELLMLGTASRSWDVLYAGSCSCCDSDRNKKNSIEALPDKYLNMFDALTPVRFKLNKGRSGRYHVGYIAQEVKAAMDAAEIDSTEFGGWVMDTDEDGNPIYMLRYEEFGAIYAAKIKQLEARVAELEARV